MREAIPRLFYGYSLKVYNIISLYSNTYPTSNAKSLACDTANEHALERRAAAVRQLSNGTNGDDLYIPIYLYIHIYMNTIQTVNSPMYDTYMSTPGNTAKLGATHSNIQTAQRGPSLVGSEPTMH